MTGPSRAGSVAVIIPAVNEAETLPATLKSVLRQNPAPVEVVVVDGGSNDGTVRLARDFGARVLFASPCRGGQLHTGAVAVKADTLLFLHADARLPEEALKAIQESRRNHIQAGKFRITFEHRHRVLSTISFFSRFARSWTSFGDSGFFVSRSLYMELGGFREIPLFEDVEFFARARRATRFRVVPLSLQASCRRFCRVGPGKQLAINILLFVLYRFGVAPARLAEWYRPWRDHRGTAPSGEILSTRRTL